MKLLRLERIKQFVLFILASIMFASCSTGGEGNGGPVYTNLAEYIANHSVLDSAGLIACAASDELDSNTVYIFYLLPDSLFNEPRLFETDSIVADDKDFSQYKEKTWPTEPLFNGRMARVVRNDAQESWSILNGKGMGSFYQCNPIQLKHQGKATEHSTKMDIDLTDPMAPVFSWEDGKIKENVIYFQAISDAQGNLISGTYTTDKHFKYNDFSNVVFDINLMSPPPLRPKQQYHITLMAVSLDNWVNLFIEKDFMLP